MYLFSIFCYRETIIVLKEEIMFVDEAQIFLHSGNGGAGCVSYHREKYLPRGGPDGGDGGKGADIIFKVNPHLKSLFNLVRKKIYRAENGQPGGGNKKTGKSGRDLIIEIPMGTLLKDESGQVLHDLCSHTSQTCVLQGGLGGKGNHFFKNSRNQAPSFAQPGQKSQEKLIHLELKLIADLGLIGFPNAGKSTLLSQISEATPKIGNYPFTTLNPHLGVLQLPQRQDIDPITIADIPGLVVDAHKGVGLGHNFLKHIDRSQALIYVLDALSESGPINDYKALQKEILCYQKNKDVSSVDTLPPLLQRPHMIALNKIDAISNNQLKEILSTFQKNNISIVPISAKNGLGLQSFFKQIEPLAHKVTRQDLSYQFK